MIHIIRERATAEQLSEMMEKLENYVKLAVDVRRGILAGGGALHADCETVLLEDGSRQEDIWGADWYPSTQGVTYEALINLRPSQGNYSMEITEEGVRAQVSAIAHRLMGDV